MFLEIYYVEQVKHRSCETTTQQYNAFALSYALRHDARRPSDICEMMTVLGTRLSFNPAGLWQLEESQGTPRP